MSYRTKSGDIMPSKIDSIILGPLFIFIGILIIIFGFKNLEIFAIICGIVWLGVGIYLFTRMFVKKTIDKKREKN